MANDQKPAARGTSAVFSYKLLLMFVLTMFRVFSAVLLLCVCGVCVRVSAERAGDFGVKLCGREFIRAVIFTCGGSRWRRSAHEPGLLLLDAFQDAVDTERALSPDTETSLAELLPVMMSDGPETLERTRPDRRKRNFSMGLAGMCCNQGCTKNDIGLLC
ncbi:relaxin-3-like [Carassius auratus]|uniref:Relaxin-3-like n=1 Tax=Carassius auratus TaxID=7957 RepID=A0A6P6NT58_CARAU|nr:relaxin-3-like [Carassius auratus]XP_026111619.1 relaxin-3-like [Carassius auratus]XP_052393650.1 prorelaxin H1 isoform X2 [Carassius gibelio]